MNIKINHSALVIMFNFPNYADGLIHIIFSARKHRINKSTVQLKLIDLEAARASGYLFIKYKSHVFEALSERELICVIVTVTKVFSLAIICLDDFPRDIIMGALQ